MVIDRLIDSFPSVIPDINGYGMGRFDPIHGIVISVFCESVIISRSILSFPFPFLPSNLSRQPINAESIDPKLRSTTLAGSLGNLPWTGTGDRGRGLQVASRDKAVR